MASVCDRAAALVYRGQALPLSWIVLSSGGAAVALERYKSISAQFVSNPLFGYADRLGGAKRSRYSCPH
ncbi:MAG: hypothetical protein WBF29_01485, partial [Syntrophobacteria bacterium]